MAEVTERGRNQYTEKQEKMFFFLLCFSFQCIDFVLFKKLEM